MADIAEQARRAELDVWLADYLLRQHIEQVDELTVARSLHGEEGYYRTLISIKEEDDRRREVHRLAREESDRVAGLTDEEAVAELRAARNAFLDLARRVKAKGLRIEFALTTRSGGALPLNRDADGFTFEVHRVIKS